MPVTIDNTHTDEVYNRAIIRLYRAAIAAAERLEAEEAKAGEQREGPTDRSKGHEEGRQSAA